MKVDLRKFLNISHKNMKLLMTQYQLHVQLCEIYTITLIVSNMKCSRLVIMNKRHIKYLDF